MTQEKAPVPVSVLADRIEYDPATGNMIWKMRPREDFPTHGDHQRWIGNYCGKAAFTNLGRDGYLRGEVRYLGRRYSLMKHVVAFAIYYGAYAVGQIDHANRVRSDNRISNLREISASENTWNSVNPPGRYLRGARKNGSTWYASISKNRKLYYLGKFNSEIEAHQAYIIASIDMHGEFSPYHPKSVLAAIRSLPIDSRKDGA